MNLAAARQDQVLLDLPCPVIPRPTVRPTGTPPRCRQCRDICHPAPNTGMDRFCPGCHPNTRVAFRCSGRLPAELPILDWLANAPFTYHTTPLARLKAEK